MKILVLLKQVPANLRVTLDKHFNIDRGLTENMLNPADKSALDLALRLREQAGGKIACLTMGPNSAADCLREAAIHGADSLYHLCDKRLAGADSFMTAMALSRAVEKINDVDLILCGQKTVDGETGQVGPELARLLGYTCLTNVLEVELVEEGTVLCRRLTEAEEQRYRVPLPGVMAVCGFPVTARLPSLTQLRAARKKEIRTLSVKELGLPMQFSAREASPTRVVQL